MELQRPVYQNWQWSYKIRRKLCRGFSKLPMRIAISSSDSYARNSLSRLSIFRCPFGRPQCNRKERRLVVSNCRPSILSDLAEIGNQIVQNLKFLSDPKIPAPEDSGISDRNFVYDSLVENLMNQVSSLGSFDIFAATLGFVAGLALYLSRFKQQNSVDTCARNAGDWILFTSPTPFNRFVVLRCPSIAFQDGALLEDVNRKLAKDNRHFVKLSSGSEVSGYSCKGRIPSSNSLSRSPVDSHNFDINVDGSELCYQRICLNAEDGGVVSLDWPASLDLAEEQGLDTTVLLVPGTTEGSRDECVQDFVRKALQYGYFPVVMNPRGCGGSPLTTPRLIGFACMALLLWSPVVVPLLPTLIQHWTLHTSGGVVGCATIVGLYGALVILVTIWGKRIRGYENPLEQYGLTISSTSKLLDLGRGLVIGLALVISLFLAKVFLGYATLTLIPEFSFSSPTSIVFAIKTYWRILRVVGQAFGMGLAVATVEELLFRSWLHEEIAADLGFHKAVILSGLVFSLIHWSLPVMPGLWLLSVALSGARVKGNGNLSVPIGLHAGLIAGNFIIHAGGFIRYNSNAPAWITGSYAGHPLAGALGLSLVATLAILLYPWEIIRRHRSMDFNKEASAF